MSWRGKPPLSSICLKAKNQYAVADFWKDTPSESFFHNLTNVALFKRAIELKRFEDLSQVTMEMKAKSPAKTARVGLERIEAKDYASPLGKTAKKVLLRACS
jgi:hypothetical protein